eukprot:1097216-Rhodomonas_salina.1
MSKPLCGPGTEQHLCFRDEVCHCPWPGFKGQNELELVVQIETPSRFAQIETPSSFGASTLRTFPNQNSWRDASPVEKGGRYTALCGTKRVVR